MSGKEAWDLISPYINPMEHQEFNNKEMSEAYITIYIACKELDERDEEKK